MSQTTLSWLSSIEEVVEDARNGKMFILVDDEDRENEGDLVIPAQMATPEAVNFMARYGRGLVCLSLTRQRVEDLGLHLMAPRNGTRHQTAFTVSIEAREGVTTGISAADRARTIAVAIDEKADRRDIVTPGHVFPLMAQDGGVLVRAGHTEAAVDIARMAGLTPAGVICEIMNDDGTMARMPDLVPFAQRHGLKIGTIEDLIAYRLKNDRIVDRTATTRVDSVHGGAFELYTYVTKVDPVEHLALVKGDLSTPGPVLVRVHAVSVAADLLGIGSGAERMSLVQKAMEMISDEGRGVIVLIRDLRPHSVSEWIGTRSPDPRAGRSEERNNVEIGIGSQILRDLGVREMILLSNQPQSRYVGLEGYGLSIVGNRRIE